MLEDPAPKVTPYLLRRAGDMCARRLDQEYRGEYGSDDPVNRGRARAAFLDAARTAHSLPGRPADAPWRVPPDLEAEERAVVEQAIHWYRHLFGDAAVTLVDHDLDRPSEVAGIEERLGGWVDLTVVDSHGQRELRQFDFWAGDVGRDPLEHWGVRLALLRLSDWLEGEPVRVSLTDLLRGVRAERVVDPRASLAEVRTDLEPRVVTIRERAASGEPRPGADCATCRYCKGCPAFPRAIKVRVRRGDLLPGVLSITPSSVEAWTRCPRLWRTQHVLAAPASDDPTPGDHGRQVHALLRLLHQDGPCDDPARVDEIVAGHGASARVHAELSDHARRCPTGAKSYGHELTRARLYPRYPNFLASARFDTVWIHGDVLDVRDYKTGGARHSRVADDPRARLQAWVMAPVAAELGLRLRLRYEQLATEIDDDPEPWEPDPDDLIAAEDEFVALVTAMRAENDWRGVADPDVCRWCRYRSICPDSATPGQPVWPRVDDAEATDDP